MSRFFILLLVAMASFGSGAEPLLSGAHSACADCHRGHGRSPSGILKRESPSATCMACHQEAGDRGDLRPGRLPPPRLAAAPETFASQHLVRRRGRAELAGRQKNRVPFGCTSCHSPHAGEWRGTGAARTMRGAPALGGAGEGGAPAPPTVSEVCLRCHDAPGGGGEWPNPRLLVGQRFGASVVSGHRVGARSRGDLPSLRGWKPEGGLDCVSCHAGSPESGLRGPHASNFPALLNAPYSTSDGTPESEEAYRFCYQCHRRESILSNESFALHREHITGMSLRPGEPVPGPPKARSGWPAFPRWGMEEAFPQRRVPGMPLPNPPGNSRGGWFRPTSCATCHDAHGSLEYASIIAFDRRVVYPNRFGVIDFWKTPGGDVSCSLECHGHDHDSSRAPKDPW